MEEDPYIAAFEKFNRAILDAIDTGELSNDEMVEMVDTAWSEAGEPEDTVVREPKQRKQ